MDLHPTLESHWPQDLETAIEVQESLRPKVVREGKLGELKYVAGVDVGFEEDGTVTRAAVAVLEFPSLRLVEAVIAKTPTLFPYIPGYLSFREIPAVLKALRELQFQPDVLLCDGQGIAHPRRLGIASHLGVLVDIPTIGVAKSILVGRHAEVPDIKGARVPLIHRKEIVGVALRTRVKTKPLFISLGHKIDLQSSIE
jgi:deoxyribonuclease V